MKREQVLEREETAIWTSTFFELEAKIFHYRRKLGCTTVGLE